MSSPTPSSSFTCMPQTRIAAVLDVLEGESLETCAQRHGVSSDELAAWRTLYLAGARSIRPLETTTQRRFASRRQALWSAAALALIAGVVSTSVLARTHAAQQAALTTFRPGEPARASEINDNFSLLQSWIEQKLGPTSEASIQLKSPVYAQDDMVSDGGFGLTFRALPTEKIEPEEWHKAKLWAQVVIAGNSCTSTCGQAACLTSYLNGPSAMVVKCEDSTKDRMCVCLGRAE